MGTVVAITSNPDPVYIDYGSTVVYEGDTVYVEGKEVPAAEYNEVAIEAAQVEQPPPPVPAEDGSSEWMPLGVFALAQEEKGDPVAMFQISVSKDGLISGGYQSLLSDDQKPIAGKVDKETQRVGWRIGDNLETIYETSLGNLTLDVAPVALHFGKDRTQTWLLVRMPEPGEAGKDQAIPEASKTPPPLASSEKKE